MPNTNESIGAYACTDNINEIGPHNVNGGVVYGAIPEIEKDSDVIVVDGTSAKKKKGENKKYSPTRSVKLCIIVGAIKCNEDSKKILTYSITNLCNDDYKCKFEERKMKRVQDEKNLIQRSSRRGRKR